MAKSSLDQAVKKLVETGKSKIGYSTANQYKDVLEALQQSKYKVTDAEGGSVQGRYSSYGDVQSLQFDSNGFSTDPNAAIWKMKLNRWGAIPVLSEGLVVMGGTERQKGLAEKGEFPNQECPYKLEIQSSEGVNSLPDSFWVGAKIDVSDTAVNYFNKMFLSGGDHDVKVQAHHLASLIRCGYLYAEMIFPKLNASFNVDIVGNTLTSNHNVIYLNNCIIGSNGWDKTGLKVQANIDGKTVQIAPNGSSYKYHLQGNNYNFKSRSIDNFGKDKYNQWASPAVNGTQKLMPVNIMEQDDVDVYVRLFMTEENQAKINTILTMKYSHEVYNTYGKLIANSSTASPIPTGGSPQVQLAIGIDRWKRCVYWGDAAKPKKRCKEQLRYRYSGGHDTFTYQGQNGSDKMEQAGQGTPLFSPLFVPNNWDGDLDCSSFALMVWCSSGLFKQTAKIPCPSTISMMSMTASSYDEYLKPQYTLQIHQMTPTIPLLPGDWIVKGPKQHVVVMVDETTSQVIQVSSKDVKNRTTLSTYNVRACRRIIRVVERQRSNNSETK